MSLASRRYGLYSALEEFIPTHYAIPEEQWNAIAEMLQTIPGQRVEKVNAALDWMNIGPSGYKP